MTNILAAFQKLEERMVTLSEELSITIVFISDGQDTCNGIDKVMKKIVDLKGGMGRSINFICLGIQSGFPTNLAMSLRTLYHTGSETIPAVYLIEYASEKAFFNKFETMSDCFKATNKITCPNAGEFIKEYPWQNRG